MVERVHQKKFIAKMVLLGDFNAGKTSLINKFAKGVAGNPQATVGTDFMTKQISIDDKQVTLMMWDTAGQEKHSAAIGSAFYRGANSCILTFDLSSSASFDRLDFWKQNFIEKGSPPNAATFPFIVVGNKTDLERSVTREQAEAWCASNGGYPYFETCATGDKATDGVEQLFMSSGKKAVEQSSSAAKDDEDMPMSLTGASGAITIDRKTEVEATQNLEKKKKKCKC